MNKIKAVLKNVHSAVMDLENEVKVYHLETHVERIKEKATALLALAVDNGENLFEEEQLFLEEINKRKRKPVKPFTLTRMHLGDGGITLSLWTRQIGEIYIGAIR